MLKKAAIMIVQRTPITMPAIAPLESPPPCKAFPVSEPLTVEGVGVEHAGPNPQSTNGELISGGKLLLAAGNSTTVVGLKALVVLVSDRGTLEDVLDPLEVLEAIVDEFVVAILIDSDREAAEVELGSIAGVETLPGEVVGDRVAIGGVVLEDVVLGV